MTRNVVGFGTWRFFVPVAMLCLFFASVVRPAPVFADDLPTGAITSFSFFSLSASSAFIGDPNIAVSVPYGTDVTALTPTITYSGQSVSPASGVAQDFTDPVTYTVDIDGSSFKSYVVTVSVMSEIESAKVDAYVTLSIAHAGYSSSDYSEENWTTLSAFKTDGDTAIDAASDLDGVASAELTALSGMAGVITLSEAEAIASATDAVAAAEESEAQSAVDSAQTLVSALPTGTAQSDLQSRLDAVQASIDAAIAQEVQALIDPFIMLGSLTLPGTAVSEARTAYDALSDSQKLLVTNLAFLVAAEKVISDLSSATDAVSAAEGNITQSSVDSAQTLVSALPTGTAQSDLQLRLDAVQASIDAVFEVSQVTALIAALPPAGSLALPGTQVSLARAAYDSLSDAQTLLVSGYMSLVSAEAVISTLSSATDAVAAAEGNRTQEDVDSARTLVLNLPIGEAKTDLQSRLDIVQASIDAVALADLKSKAHESILSEFLKYDEDDYFSDDWDDLVSSREDGDDDVDGAITFSTVEIAKKKAIDGMDSVKTIEQTEPDPVNDLKAEYRPETRFVRISWSVDDEHVDKVLLYRGTSDDFSVRSSALIVTRNAEDESYTDKDVDGGKTYYYKAITMNEAGTKSGTETTEVVIPGSGSSSILETDKPASTGNVVSNPSPSTAPVLKTAASTLQESRDADTSDPTSGGSGSVLGSESQPTGNGGGSGFFGSVWIWLLLGLGIVSLLVWQWSRLGNDAEA